MDLFSAARWLSRPFRFTPELKGEALPIDARAVIGDGFTCAFVRVDGAIDWLCFPRFDSPSVFAAVLDPERGGESTVTPARRPFESLQRYDPDTNVLETLFRVEGEGVVRLTDYMPWTNDPRSAIHEIHRRVECLEGEVSLDVRFDPRFGFGMGVTRLEQQEHGVLALGDSGERFAAVVSDGERWTVGERGAHARLKLRSGERRWVILSWFARRCEEVNVYRPFDHLRATRKAWREWSRQLTYEGPWRHHVLRSALILKLLIYAPTGAMVAAPSTSLPEWIGGQRNWDYRYFWTRDAALGIRAANLIGYSSEAREFFHFIRDALDRAAGLQALYAVDGLSVPEERELHHLAGFRRSSPVRVGNLAKAQLQHDTSGALLDAAWLYERFGGALTLRAWRHLRDVVDNVRRIWREPDHGMWEPRSTPRANLHSRLMCWLALNRGARVALLFGDKGLYTLWRSEAKVIRADILRHGIDSSERHLVSTYGGSEPDAALLLTPSIGFLEARHPLVTNTIDWIRETLGSGPYLRRYRMEDGVPGPEGAFIVCGFWLAEALAMANRLDEAQDVFVANAETSNHVGLLAEEVDPVRGEQLGNFPQAFSHLGLINAAARIDLGLRLRDEGSRRTPHLLRP